MNLFDQISEDIKTAMKAREQARLEALRGIKKALIEAKTSTEAGGELADEDAIRIIQKLAKQGRDSAEIYRQQNRTDLCEQEMGQVAVFESYLPKQLSDEEIAFEIQNIITQLGVTDIKDLGKVMGVAQSKLAGVAESKKIVAQIRAFLK